MPLQQSQLFEPITDAQLRDIVRAALSPDTEVAACRLIEGGHFNTAYDISTRNPDCRLVLRIAPRADRPLLNYEHTMMLAEPRIYETLRRGGVPTSRVVAVDGSRSIVDRVYILIDFIDALPLNHSSISADTRKELMREVGEYAAKMHAITIPIFGRIMPDGSIRGGDSWADVFGELFTEICEKCRESDVMDPAEIDAALDALSRYRAVFDECREPVLVHNDIWDPNILVKQEDGVWSVKAIIDADRAIFADREYEFALWEDADPDLLIGYGHPIDTSEEARTRRLFYRLQLYMMYAWFYKVPTTYPDFQAYSRRTAGEIIEHLRCPSKTYNL